MCQRFLVLYGCGTLSLSLREGHKLRVFKSRLLKRISEPKRDEMTGCWGKLHNEDLNNLHTLPSINIMIKSKTMRLAEHVARRGRGGMHIGFGWES
jgi:hypothetical protein